MAEGPSFRTTLSRIYWTRQALRLALVTVTAWLLITGIASLQSAAASVFSGLNSAGGLLESLGGAFLQAIAVPAGCMIVLVAAASTIQARDIRRRDPIRRFSRQQRRTGMARANGQCELESAFGGRCSRPAEHGDHYYPWSKGGATSLRNFAAACSRCNRAKGARLPTPGQQARLEKRRRSYVNSAEMAMVGERRSL
ncbi:HNH endonuclease [Paenarthrobacter sp. NyZ202]|uniref:HNH endonuclease n=1 Tax=Paenarthrobacter sp. NyZ202 TaxID=3402689 RepID=UPI003CE788DE